MFFFLSMDKLKHDYNKTYFKHILFLQILFEMYSLIDISMVNLPFNYRKFAMLNDLKSVIRNKEIK